MLASAFFMLISEIILFTIGLILFNLTVWSEIPYLIAVFVIGTLSFTAVGTLLSAIAVNTKLREVLLPLMLFPVILPVLINAVEATDIVLNNSGYEGLKQPLTVMAVFTIIFGTVSYLLFERVLEE
jgi:heme exporter protein B